MILAKINLPPYGNRKNKIEKLRLTPKFWRSKLACRRTRIKHKLQERVLRVTLQYDYYIPNLRMKNNSSQNDCATSEKSQK